MVMTSNVSSIGLTAVSCFGRVSHNIGRYSTSEEEAAQDSSPHNSGAHSL